VADVEDLGRGIALIRLPLPIPRLPFVNAYVFQGADGVVLIDPGGGHPEGYAALVAGLAELGHGPDDLSLMIGTHLHPDHIGLAARLVDETGCAYLMHRSAADRVAGYNDWGPWQERIVALAGRHGAPPAQLEAMARHEPRPDWAPPSPVPDVLGDHGGLIPISSERHLSAVYTPGHDASHICLIDSETGALLSGDHVLPRVTPFVPFPPEDDDNLGTYLASLERIEALDPPITYPAHHNVIERGAARARQIRLHHRRRLDGMMELLAHEPASAWSVVESSFKPNLPPLHARLALQETLAHLEYLRLRGRLVTIESNGHISYVGSGR